MKLCIRRPCQWLRSTEYHFCLPLSFCLRRKRRATTQRNAALTSYAPATLLPDLETADDGSYKRTPSDIGREGGYPSNYLSTYHHPDSSVKLKSGFPPVPAHHSQSSLQSAHAGSGGARRGHLYETPRIPNEVIGSDGKVYFELDPSDEPHSRKGT